MSRRRHRIQLANRNLPAASEAGWKGTVRADSRTVSIIVPFTGCTGCYVWHCHILEHEDNEMMRPYDVAAAS
jgi:spore coat protein A